MYLSKILINNFKNISECEIALSPKINCLTGNNGMGKTNFLDALFYLSMTKSYFNFPDWASILRGSGMASVCGTYIMDDSTQNQISVALYGKNVAENKLVKRNGKIYKKLSEHIGLLPIVMVSPTDIFLVSSGGEERRKFVNQILSQIDKEYLYKVQSYNKLLMQRNKVLKEDAENLDLLSTFNGQLSAHASYIYKAREEMTKMLCGYLSAYYAQISGERERVRVVYDSDLGKGPLEELLKKSYERDKFLTYTSVGVHKDDFLFEISSSVSGSASADGGDFYPLKRCASQGQQKCFLIALKLAQFRIMKELNGGISPILLLDDIFDKLDMNRVELLLNLTASHDFGQIFITDTLNVRLEEFTGKNGAECKYFNVADGTIMER